MINAINHVDEDNLETADSIMIGPPTGGQDSDIEKENNDALKETDMLAEVTGELEVLQFAKEHEEAPENSDNQPLVEEPEVREKKTAKKTTGKIRWKKEHITSKPPSADLQDKRAQARFLEDPNLSQITMWSIF